tara:strand:+ start:221 stop:544 length:324 start_codon:yes stop_codon:yes gene_type:complete
MAIIAKDKKTQTIVLVVNILSFISHQVKIGNEIYDIPNPKNLGPHNSSIASNAYFVPYQKNIVAGIPKTIAATKGLSDHHFHTSCELVPNHTLICPSRKNIQAIANL